MGIYNRNRPEDLKKFWKGKDGRLHATLACPECGKPFPCKHVGGHRFKMWCVCGWDGFYDSRNNQWCRHY